MKFHYIASQSDNKIIEGEMEAMGVAEVLEFLASKNLRPISLKKEIGYGSGKARWWGVFQTSISAADKIFLTKYLALMLKIGIDLFKAIDILISDFDKISVKNFLFEIRENLERGQPFYVAFENRPRDFSEVMINLIKAGESSGGLEKTLESLSGKLQNERELLQEIKSALIYPLLLVGASLAVVFFLVSFALPRISRLFSDSSIQPPLFSKIVFSIGNFLSAYLAPILIVVVAFAVASFLLFKKSPVFKSTVQRFLRKLPLLGKVLKEFAIQRFAVTLSALLAAGLPIINSLNTTADAVGDEELKEALLRISKDGVAKGLTLGEAFRKEEAFPKMVVNLVAISEKSGNISSVLTTLAGFYESEIKSSVKILVSFLEPILLLIIGAIIAVIALSILVPIYQLIGKF